MVAQNTIPRLPVELVEAIITAAWHMSLSSDERITFMHSSTLVNSAWADTYDSVSSRDVYIPSAAFCDHFIRRLRETPAPVPSSCIKRFLRRFRTPAKPSLKRRSSNISCQSLTIQIPQFNDDLYKNGGICLPYLPMGAVLDNLLEQLDAHSLVPNLRRLSIEYRDAAVDDIFHRTGMAALPPQITHLDLRFSFSAVAPTCLIVSLREWAERRKHASWIARSVTHLSIDGAGKDVIQAALKGCPNTQILEVDGCVIKPPGAR
ncbi:hypothetical protein DFH06DRAFT_769792 [Mycena polygramma]|nr:hypothetical protein DFH06DRAFT_769792 [Mycena polygramma]